MKRAKHSLSHYKLFTCDMGQLVPIGVYEVLPGDTVQQSTSLLLRVSPLLAPVMHPVTVRIHHWFIPHRLVWSGWEEFITGGPDGEGGSSGTYPTITGNFAAGGMLDYMGVPPGVANLSVSALPVRSYNKVFNEFYRDEDLVTAVNVPVTSGSDSVSPVTVQRIAWEKDYFTSSRPWPQKGPEVTLPLGTTAPIIPYGANGPTFDVTGQTGTPLQSANGSAGVSWVGAATGAGPAIWNTPNLLADLATATAASVNDLREAMAIQRYQEARARYGDRYTEYLAYLGVRSSDARLQRPEYLGGGKQTISFTEVLQTGVTTDGDDTEGVGNLKGHGIAASRSRRWRRFFEEHGIVLTLLSVRPRSMYTNGMHRMWLRRTKEDYWQKELQHIGAQEVYQNELFANQANGSVVFGYQDRYAEYRHLPSNIAGEFRSTLNFWHLGRIFAAAPSLNQSFVECDPATRIFASTATDGLWCMASHSIQARRLVDRSAAGRIY